MFCSKCGCQLGETSKFCGKCGTPVFRNENTNQQQNCQQINYNNQQNVTPQNNVDYRNNYLEKLHVNIYCKEKNYNEIGDLYITENELIFVKKSKGIMIAFGLVGRTLQEGKEGFRISFADIESGCRTRIGLNNFVYQIKLRNGEIFNICLNNPAKMSCLVSRFG